MSPNLLSAKQLANGDAGFITTTCANDCLPYVIQSASAQACNPRNTLFQVDISLPNRSPFTVAAKRVDENLLRHLKRIYRSSYYLALLAQGLVPELIGFDDDNQLVFVRWISSISKRIAVANMADLLAKLHLQSFALQQAKLAAINPFNALVNLKQLIDIDDVAAGSNALLEEIISWLRPLAEDSDNQVFCHGDFNLSNILVTQSGCLMIIDWDQAGYAPAEYDLAMTLSINCFDSQQSAEFIKHYCNRGNSPLKIRPEQVTRYQLMASLINGLWYQCQFKQTADATFKHAASWFLNDSVNLYREISDKLAM